MKMLGKYEILEEIGRGGFAVVYKARDTIQDRVVALKVMAPHLLWDSDFARRFQAEFETVARLHHPNIVSVYEHGEAEGQPYIAMEYLSGVTLKRVLEEAGGPLPLEQALFISQQVASALIFALRRGIVHRDIKPSNIIIDAQKGVKLTDFGIAKVTARTFQTTTGRIFGTPEYMSPEQAWGKDLDHRSDVYSLGVVLYEMLTGQVPFAGDTPLSVMHSHSEREPPHPSELNVDLPTSVETVVLRALAKSREHRFQSARELVHYLRRAIEGKPIVIAQAPSAESKPVRLVVPAVLTGIILIVAFALVLWAVGPSIFGSSVPTRTATAAAAAADSTSSADLTPGATKPVLPTDTSTIESTATPTLTSAPTNTSQPTPVPTAISQPPTATAEPPTRPPTATAAPPTHIPTATAVPPTRTPTATAEPPTHTPTATAVPPTHTPTATAETQTVSPDERLGRFDEIPLGVSVSSSNTTRGTLGAKVIDVETGEEMILSTWSVLVGSPDAQVGDPIWQPGGLDGGTSNDTFAHLTRFILGPYDGAVATLSHSRPVSTRTVEGLPILCTTSPKLGMRVWKSGATTGFTEGVIDAIDETITLNYGEAGVVRLEKLVRIAPLPGAGSGTQLSSGGDSGAIWVDAETGKAVGLHIAGNAGSTTEFSLAHDINVVIQELNVRLPDCGAE